MQHIKVGRNIFAVRITPAHFRHCRMLLDTMWIPNPVLQVVRRVRDFTGDINPESKGR
jgi:hypothetical protein